MIRTLAWKEFREQAIVWIAVMLLVAMAMIVIVSMTPPHRNSNLYRVWEDATMVIFLGAAGLFGTVSGAMALAGDRENDTLAFLDSLAGRREPIWRTKFICAALANLAMIVVLLSTLLSLFLTDRLNRDYFAWGSLFGCLLALHTFAWSLLFGGRFSSVLLACGATVPAVIAGFLTGVTLARVVRGVVQAAWPVGGPSVSEWFWTSVQIFMLACLPVLVIYAGRELFCSEHGERERVARRASLTAAFHGTTRLAWMATKQGWLTFATVALIVAATSAWTLYGNPAAITLPIGLGIGVVCGLTPWGLEQSLSQYRFLADQRVPLGRAWTVKVGLWLMVAVVAAGVFVLSAPARRGLGAHAGSAPLPWAVAGFGVGQLAMLVFRKKIVALVFGLLVAAPLALVWWPSLCEGDFSVWPVYVPPLVMLIAGRGLIRRWAIGAMASRRGLAALAVTAAVCLVWIAVVLWYRVLSIPDIGAPFDVAAFRATIEAGNRTRAADIVQAAIAPVRKAAKALPVGAEPAPAGRIAAGRLDTTFETAFRQGWAAGPENDALDALFSEDSIVALSELPALPPGVLTRPTGFTNNGEGTLSDIQRGALDVATATLLRALQLSHRGDRQGALVQVSVALAIANTVRNEASGIAWYMAGNVDHAALLVLDRCLEDAPSKVEILSSALEIVDRHERMLPSATSIAKIDYLAIESRLAEPLADATYNWLDAHYQRDSQTWAFATNSAAFAVKHLLWRAPWEMERRRRLLNLAAAAWIAAAETPWWEVTRWYDAPLSERTVHFGLRVGHLRSTWSWAAGPSNKYRNDPMYRTSAVAHYLTFNPYTTSWEWPAFRDAQLLEATAQCEIRGSRLKLALWLYQFQQGEPAQRLAQLVPGILAELPVDPFSGESFHYRPSTGEVLSSSSPNTRYSQFDARAGTESRTAVSVSVDSVTIEVPEGWGILWSVGLSERDDNARRFYNVVSGLTSPDSLAPIDALSAGAADYVFLVPRIAKAD